MKILHVCLQAPYNDYWGYQDNLLPKYQKKLGHEVTVLTTNTLHKDGKIQIIGEREYYLDDGQKIIRKQYKKILSPAISKLIKYFDIYAVLEKEKPDFIYVHGLGNISVLQIAKYLKKNKECKAVADNHVDYYNESPLLKKNRLIRLFFVSAFKILNRYMQDFYQKVYGVTPWRIQYQCEVFGINHNKCDLLVLGADDEKIDYANKLQIKKKIRTIHNIPEDAFLIVTGGKIDITKNVHVLIDAIRKVKTENLYLLVFGSIEKDVLQKIGPVEDNVKLIGWIDSDKVYDYFLSSDLVVFPGTHSVLWEQACACGVPGIFKKWDGMDHVDVGGNCKFWADGTVEGLISIVNDVIGKQEYTKMLQVAESKARKQFLYSEIAKKSLETI